MCRLIAKAINRFSTESIPNLGSAMWVCPWRREQQAGKQAKQASQASQHRHTTKRTSINTKSEQKQARRRQASKRRR